jgi:hypothetical protein
VAKKQSTNDVAENLKVAFAEFVDTVMSGVSASAEAEDEDEEDEDFEPLDREETEALGIKELRALAAERGVDEKKKADIIAALDEGGHFADEEEDDEEGDEDEEEGYTQEELEDLDLKQLRAIAKEGGATSADVKGLDQDALIELILGESDEDEEDEDEEGDEEDETEELDEDALNAMSLTELKSLAKELEVKVKVPASAKTDKAKKKVFVETILNSGDDE